MYKLISEQSVHLHFQTFSGVLLECQETLCSMCVCLCLFLLGIILLRHDLCSFFLKKKRREQLQMNLELNPAHKQDSVISNIKPDRKCQMLTL
jgi:hypothetical protein